MQGLGIYSLEAELCPLASNIWDGRQGSNQGDRTMFDLFVDIMQASAIALQGFPAFGLHMKSEGSGT